MSFFKKENRRNCISQNHNRQIKDCHRGKFQQAKATAKKATFKKLSKLWQSTARQYCKRATLKKDDRQNATVKKTTLKIVTVKIETIKIATVKKTTLKLATFKRTALKVATEKNCDCQIATVKRMTVKKRIWFYLSCIPLFRGTGYPFVSI